MFTMFSCSSQYNSNVFYVLPLFWQKESLNVFVLYIVWEAWRKSDQRNFGLFARAHGEKKKTSYFLSFSLDMRTSPGGGSFRLPGIVFCTNAVYIVYIYCSQLLYIGNFGEYEKVALYKSFTQQDVCNRCLWPLLKNIKFMPFKLFFEWRAIQNQILMTTLDWVTHKQTYKHLNLKLKHKNR